LQTLFSAKEKAEFTAEVTNKNDPSGEIPPNNMSTHQCPKNYKGLAKSMEACVVVSMVMEMYNATDNCISFLLMDDDSTTCSNCHHSFQEEMMAHGWANEAEH